MNHSTQLARKLLLPHDEFNLFNYLMTLFPGRPQSEAKFPLPTLPNHITSVTYVVNYGNRGCICVFQAVLVRQETRRCSSFLSAQRLPTRDQTMPNRHLALGSCAHPWPWYGVNSLRGRDSTNGRTACWVSICVALLKMHLCQVRGK
jgi:hypothetical protein